MNVPETVERVSCVCCYCGDVFYVAPRHHWKTICRDCYLEETRASKRVRELEAELAAMAKAHAKQLAKKRTKGTKGNVTVDAKRWRQLMQLCHPDRHGGSAAANDCTQWLQSIRTPS